MKLTEIIDRLSLDVFTPFPDGEAEVGTGYVGDLLSNVLASAMPGSLWITIQHHANVVAVAQVTGLAAVLIVEGKRPDDAMREQARSSGVVLLGSTESAFEVAGRLYDLLAAGK
jgi:hypothetical protein